MRKCPWVYFKERHLRFNMTTNSSSRGISSLCKIGLTWRKIDSSDLVTSRTSRDISLGMCCKSNLPQMNPLSVFIYRRINIEDARLLKPSYIQKLQHAFRSAFSFERSESVSTILFNIYETINVGSTSKIFLRAHKSHTREPSWHIGAIIKSGPQ